MSATESRFQEMLNEYLPNSLLREELIKRDYILTNVQKDNKWGGGKIPVPFKGSSASSVKLGGLTAGNDIAQATYVRGYIDGYKEVWGSLIFNHKDIVEHDGKVNEKSFLNLLPDTLEEFMDYMKQVVSIQLTTGPHFAVSADVAQRAQGIIKVDRIDRFMLDQKCLIYNGTVFLAVYVIAMDLNTNEVKFSATRAGAAADLSAFTPAESVKFFHDGGDDNTNFFNSIKSVLLSAANGGSLEVHGKSKLLYPYLQAINIDGSTITASNILEQIFSAYGEVKQKCRGNANEILMSYKNFGSCLILLEKDKGSFKVAPDSTKASMYGWDEITVAQFGTNRRLKIVAIQEMDDDVIIFMDWTALTFRTNGYFTKRTSPDGKTYYETRTTSGYSYIVDTYLFGELEFRKPTTCAIICKIKY